MHLLPSDVARLVLGYLKEKCLQKTFVAFLKESPDLSEYWRMLNTGLMPTTTVMGLTLQNVLEEYAALSIRVKALEAQTSQQHAGLTTTLGQHDIDAVVESHKKAELDKERRRVRQKVRNRHKNSMSRRLKSLERNEPSSSHGLTRDRRENVETSDSSRSKALRPEGNQVEKSSEVDDLEDEIDQLLADTKLHEKLALSINKALKRDQGTSSDKSNTSSDAVKRKVIHPLDEGGGNSRVEESLHKNSPSGVAKQNVEDIISMTADDAGLEQLLSLFQFQPEMPPHNVPLSSNSNNDNHNISHSSAALYLPPVGSETALSDSSPHVHSITPAHQANLHSPQKQKSCDVSNTLISSSLSSENAVVSNISGPTYSTQSLISQSTSTSTGTVCYSHEEDLLPSSTHNTSHSVQHSCDNNIVNGTVSQHLQNDSKNNKTSLSPCNKSVSTPLIDPHVQTGPSNSTQSCKKSRIKRAPKKLSQATNQGNVECGQIRKKETSSENLEVMNQSSEDPAKLNVNSNEGDKKVEDAGPVLSIKYKAQGQTTGGGRVGVADEERKPVSERVLRSHAIDLQENTCTRRELDDAIDRKDSKTRKETDDIDARKDSNAMKEKGADHRMESDGFDLKVEKVLNDEENSTNDQSSHPTPVVDSHPLLTSNPSQRSTSPFVSAQCPENKDPLPVIHNDTDLTVPLPTKNSSYKTLKPPVYGMEENSLSLFSFIEKNSAELSGDAFISEHPKSHDSFIADIEIKSKEHDGPIDNEDKLANKENLLLLTEGNSTHKTSKEQKSSESDPCISMKLQTIDSLKENVEDKQLSNEMKLKNNEKVKLDLKEDTFEPKILSANDVLPASTSQTSTRKVNNSCDSNSSFDQQVSTPNAVLVKPLCLSSSRLERNFHLVDTCLQNILGELEVHNNESRRPLASKIVKTDDNNVEQQQKESEMKNYSCNTDIDESKDDNSDEPAKNNEVLGGESEIEKDSEAISESKRDWIEDLHDYSATISTPFVSEDVAASDDSPRKLVKNQLRNNECVSMPASLPSLMKEKDKNEFQYKSSDDSSAFSPSATKFKKQSERNFSPVMPSSQHIRRIIACDMTHSPLIPSHCKKKVPSRRITPMEVSFSTPSPLQMMSPSSPADFIIDLAHSPSQPNTPAKEVMTASPANEVVEKGDVHLKNKRQYRVETEILDQFVLPKSNKDKNGTRESEDVREEENKRISNKDFEKENDLGDKSCEKIINRKETSAMQNKGEQKESYYLKDVRKKLILTEHDTEKCIKEKVVEERDKSQADGAMKDFSRSSNSQREKELLQGAGRSESQNGTIPSQSSHSIELDQSSVSGNASGVKLPKSPSERTPRRVVPTLISKTVSKVSGDGFLSPLSSSRNGSLFCPDESKIVSSSSDPPSPHSEEEAFRLLKTFIHQSYSKPQPNQEITSSNTAGRLRSSSIMQKCGCLSREVCSHVKGKGRKSVKKLGVSYSRSKDKDSTIVNINKSSLDKSESGGYASKVGGDVVCDSSSKDDVDNYGKDNITTGVESSRSSETFIPVGIVDLGNEEVQNKQSCPSERENREKTNNVSSGQLMEIVASHEQDMPGSFVSMGENETIDGDKKDERKNSAEIETYVEVWNRSCTKSNEKPGLNTGNHNINGSPGSNEKKTIYHSPNAKLLSNHPTLEFDDHHENISLAAPYFPELSNTMDFFKLRKRRSSETNVLDTPVPGTRPELEMPKSNDLNLLSLQSEAPAHLDPSLESCLNDPPSLSEEDCLAQAMKECGIPLEPSELSFMDNSQFTVANYKTSDNVMTPSVGQEDLSMTKAVEEYQKKQTKSRNVRRSTNVSKINKTKKKNSSTPTAIQPQRILRSSSDNTPSHSSLEPLLNPATLAGKIGYLSQPNQPPVPFVILSNGKLVVLPNSYNSLLPPPPPPSPVPSAPTLPLSVPQILVPPQLPLPVPLPPALPHFPLPPVPLSSTPLPLGTTQSVPIQRSSKSKKAKPVSSKSKSKDSQRHSPTLKVRKVSTPPSLVSVQKKAVRRKIGEIELSPRKPSVSTYFKKHKKRSVIRRLSLLSEGSPALKKDVQILYDEKKESIVGSPEQSIESDRVKEVSVNSGLNSSGKEIERVHVFEDPVTESAQNYEDTVTENAQNYEDTVTENAQNYEDTVTESAQNYEDTVTENAQNYEDTVTENAQNYEDTVTENAQNYEDTVTENAQNYEDPVTESAQNYEDTVTENAQNYEDTVTENAQNYEDTVTETTESAQNYEGTFTNISYCTNTGVERCGSEEFEMAVETGENELGQVENTQEIFTGVMNEDQAAARQLEKLCGLTDDQCFVEAPLENVIISRRDENPERKSKDYSPLERKNSERKSGGHDKSKENETQMVKSENVDSSPKQDYSFVGMSKSVGNETQKSLEHFPTEKEKLLTRLSLRKKPSLNKTMNVEKGKDTAKVSPKCVVDKKTPTNKSRQRTAHFSHNSTTECSPDDTKPDYRLKGKGKIADISISGTKKQNEDIENLGTKEGNQIVSPFLSTKKISFFKGKSFTDIIRGVSSHNDSKFKLSLQKRRPRSSDDSPVKSRRGKRKSSGAASSHDSFIMEPDLCFAKVIRDTSVSLMVLDGGDIIKDVSDTDSRIDLSQSVEKSAKGNSRFAKKKNSVDEKRSRKNLRGSGDMKDREMSNERKNMRRKEEGNLIDDNEDELSSRNESLSLSDKTKKKNNDNFNDQDFWNEKHDPSRKEKEMEADLFKEKSSLPLLDKGSEMLGQRKERKRTAVIPHEEDTKRKKGHIDSEMSSEPYPEKQEENVGRNDANLMGKSVKHERNLFNDIIASSQKDKRTEEVSAVKEMNSEQCIEDEAFDLLPAVQDKCYNDLNTEASVPDLYSNNGPKILREIKRKSTSSTVMQQSSFSTHSSRKDSSNDHMTLSKSKRKNSPSIGAPQSSSVHSSRKDSCNERNAPSELKRKSLSSALTSQSSSSIPSSVKKVPNELIKRKSSSSAVIPLSSSSKPSSQNDSSNDHKTISDLKRKSPLLPVAPQSSSSTPSSQRDSSNERKTPNEFKMKSLPSAVMPQSSSSTPPSQKDSGNEGETLNELVKRKSSPSASIPQPSSSIHSSQKDLSKDCNTPRSPSAVMPESSSTHLSQKDPSNDHKTPSELKRKSSLSIVAPQSSPSTHSSQNEDQSMSLGSPSDVIPSSQSVVNSSSPFLQPPVTCHPTRSSQDPPISPSQRSTGSSKSITKKKINKLINRLYKTPSGT